jgi:hypothetical protein
MVDSWVGWDTYFVSLCDEAGYPRAGSVGESDWMCGDFWGLRGCTGRCFVEDACVDLLGGVGRHILPFELDLEENGGFGYEHRLPRKST